MARSVITGKRTIEGRKKVKTGCGTCRIRKVKCDEAKPLCQKCVKTGRNCDGYESPFRILTSQPIKKVQAGGIRLGSGSQHTRAATSEIAPPEIDLLNRSFSIKTMLGVKLECDQEAKQLLQASLTDPSIRYAVLSLRALREDLDTSRDGTAYVAQHASSYDYGLQQYNLALGGLAYNLSSPDPRGLKSALFCCQLFISIEQLLGNYAAMAQHIIRGLRIMHEYRTRGGNIEGESYDKMPLLDVFIVKLFSAPCHFADSPTAHQQSVECSNLRALAPDMRKELTKIAASMLNFLDNLPHVETERHTARLRADKAALLDALQLWLSNADTVQKESKSSGAEPLSVSFLRFFHQIMKIVALGVLDSSADIQDVLRAEGDLMQGIADDIGKRVRAYGRSGTKTSS